MRYSLDSDQESLHDSVERFACRPFDARLRQQESASPEGFSVERWRTMAAMGWQGAAIAECYGGLGLGPRERGIVMEGLGRGLALEPYWSSAVVGAELVARVASEEQCSELLPRVADGSVRLAFAAHEPGGRYDWARVACRAERKGDRYRIDGAKIAVLDAPSADRILLLARTSGDPSDPAGLSLFWIRRDVPGLAMRSFPALDGRLCADLMLDGVEVPLAQRLGPEGGIAAGVETALDHAMVAACFEAVGAMTGALEATVAHLQSRRQFGRPLAEFQVLRHRVADMLVATEQTRSLAIRAAGSLGADARARRRIACAAKVQAGRSGRFVGEAAVQLHGGMGMTDEHCAGHYLKRLLVTDMTLGDTQHHLARFVALS